MERLTKTEQKIMEDASRTGNVCVTTQDGIGKREMNALLSLISRGYLVRLPEACGTAREYTRNRARRTIYLNTVSAKIAE